MSNLMARLGSTGANLRAIARWANELTLGELETNPALIIVRDTILAMVKVGHEELASLAANELETQEMMAIAIEKMADSEDNLS